MKLDDVIEEYEGTKRSKGYSLYYDSAEDNVYSSNKEMNDVVVIADTYDFCRGIIGQYLDEPGISQYRDDCRRELKRASNKVVSFLWFFDHIDGAYDFELYETVFIKKMLVKFCRANGLPIIDLDEYSEENHIHTFLTEKRMKQMSRFNPEK